jgi:hypothetical protein
MISNSPADQITVKTIYTTRRDVTIFALLRLVVLWRSACLLDSDRGG